jgi:tRNA threonylcarbamoyladenosine biosynthesis protein TsaE
VNTADQVLRLGLPDEAATLALGARLASAMTALGLFPALLLHGELGAGKTTLVRGVVQALPGGSEAEVSSPSFNYMNSYPTQPECLHFDLYRLQNHGVDDELLEAMHDAGKLVIVEWAEFCPEPEAPRERLVIRLSLRAPGRELALAGQGDAAARVLARLRLPPGPAMPAG